MEHGRRFAEESIRWPLQGSNSYHVSAFGVSPRSVVGMNAASGFELANN